MSAAEAQPQTSPGKLTVFPETPSWILGGSTSKGKNKQEKVKKKLRNVHRKTPNVPPVYISGYATGEGYAYCLSFCNIENDDNNRLLFECV